MTAKANTDAHVGPAAGVEKAESGFSSLEPALEHCKSELASLATAKADADALSGLEARVEKA